MSDVNALGAMFFTSGDSDYPLPDDYSFVTIAGEVLQLGVRLNRRKVDKSPVDGFPEVMVELYMNLRRSDSFMSEKKQLYMQRSTMNSTVRSYYTKDLDHIVWRFWIPIRSDFLPSFDHPDSSFQITYTVKASVSAMLITSRSIEKSLKVLPLTNSEEPLLYPLSMGPVPPEAYSTRIHGGVLSGRGTLSVRAQLDRCAYACGETMKIKLLINNDTPVTIHGVFAEMMMWLFNTEKRNFEYTMVEAESGNLLLQTNQGMIVRRNPDENMVSPVDNTVHEAKERNTATAQDTVATAFVTTTTTATTAHSSKPKSKKGRLKKEKEESDQEDDSATTTVLSKEEEKSSDDDDSSDSCDSEEKDDSDDLATSKKGRKSGSKKREASEDEDASESQESKSVDGRDSDESGSSDDDDATVACSSTTTVASDEDDSSQTPEPKPKVDDDKDSNCDDSEGDSDSDTATKSKSGRRKSKKRSKDDDSATKTCPKHKRGVERKGSDNSQGSCEEEDDDDDDSCTRSSEGESTEEPPKNITEVLNRYNQRRSENMISEWDRCVAEEKIAAGKRVQVVFRLPIPDCGVMTPTYRYGHHFVTHLVSIVVSALKVNTVGAGSGAGANNCLAAVHIPVYICTWRGVPNIVRDRGLYDKIIALAQSGDRRFISLRPPKLPVLASVHEEPVPRTYGEAGAPAMPRHVEAVPRRAQPRPNCCRLCNSPLLTHCIVPCGHKCLCAVCAGTLQKSAKPKCPVCQKPCQFIIQVHEA